MDKTNFLPYSKRSFDKEFKDKSKRYLAYCKRIYNPYMKKIIQRRKYNYISNYFNSKPKEHIDFILNQKTTYGKSPEFIYFDIKKYYPSVDHKTLKTILVKHYLYSRGARNLEGKDLDILLEHKFITRYFKYFLNFLDEYFSYSIFPGKGLLLSTPLTYFLAEIYLFDILIKLKTHIIRWNDDIVFISKKPLTSVFKDTVLSMKKFGLTINPLKLKHGILFKDNLNYIGFEIRKQSNHIYIKEEKIFEYFLKVENILFTKTNQRLKTKIRKIRRLQFGFFYYYRICNIKYIWEDITKKTRQKVRKYLLKYGSLKHNFYIENKHIHKLGIIDFVELL